MAKRKSVTKRKVARKGILKKAGSASTLVSMVSQHDAKSLISVSQELAATHNLGTSTAVSTVFSKRGEIEQKEISRRFLVLGSAAAGSILTLASSGFVPDLLKDILSDPQIGTPWQAEARGVSLSPDFMDFVEKSRHLPQFGTLFHERFPQADNTMKWIISSTKHFDSPDGLILTPIENYHNLYRLASDDQTRLFSLDLLTARFTREGNGKAAWDILSEADPDSLTAKGAPFLIERLMTTRYISLPEEHYLKPQTWEFDRALALFNQHIGFGLDMQLRPTERGLFELHRGPKISQEAVAQFVHQFGVKGVYAVFWALQYLIAAGDRETAKEVSDVQYEFLRGVANSPDHLIRQVWNALFFAGLQLHRLGHRTQRNKFFRTLVGHDGFWPVRVSASDHLNQRLSANDVVPICFAIVALSDHEIRDRLRIDTSMISRIVRSRDELAAQKVRAAVDIFRKAKGESVDVREAVRDYLVSDGSLGIYLPPHDAILQSAIEL